MPRFDVYAHPDRNLRKATPYLLDVQNEFIMALETRVVVPLRDARLFERRLKDLHQEFTIGGISVVMDTPSMAAFPVRGLTKQVDSLASRSQEIGDALDALFGGY